MQFGKYAVIPIPEILQLGLSPSGVLMFSVRSVFLLDRGIAFILSEAVSELETIWQVCILLSTLCHCIYSVLRIF